MITQEYSIKCQAPASWLDPSAGFVARGDSDELVCTWSSKTDATSSSEAQRTFQRAGWYVADTGATYCRSHSENARHADRTARSSHGRAS